VARQYYYPYGQVRYASGTLPTDREFTGQYAEEPGLGSLMFFNARFYSPALGRFVSADTIVPEPGDPQALNRYAFVLNNPLKYIDPTGHCAGTPESNPECWEELEALEGEFGIDIDTENIGRVRCARDGELCNGPLPWSLRQLRFLRLSLESMKAQYGSELLVAIFTGVVFRIEGTIQLDEPAAGQYEQNREDYFTPEKNVVTFEADFRSPTAIHEMWHRVDDWVSAWLYGAQADGSYYSTYIYGPEFNLDATCRLRKCAHDERPWEDFANSGTDFTLNSQSLRYQTNNRERYQHFRELIVDLRHWYR